MITQTNKAGPAAAFVLLAPDVIKANQDVIKTSLAGLDAQVHANAVQCLAHAEKHGDTSLMRRLLVDTLGGKNGYRTQGLIGWMRMFSPMELKGDTINLSGMKDGQKRPFDIPGAEAKPFWSIRALNEVVKPVYRDTLMSPINRVIKSFMEAKDNTVVTEAGPQPVDVSKPFYDGIHNDAVVIAFDQIKAILAKLPADNTHEVRKARQDAAGLIAFADANEPKVEDKKVVNG